MGRTKVRQKKELKSWEEVNEALRKIAEMKSTIAVATAQYNEEEAKKRKELDDLVNPIADEISALEAGMQDFCVINRADFGNKKGKELANGRVDFRLGQPKVEKRAGMTWAAILDVVRKSRFAKVFIRVKEELDKEQILAYYAGTENAANDLDEVFLRVEQDETFGYDVYLAAETGK